MKSKRPLWSRIEVHEALGSPVRSSEMWEATGVSIDSRTLQAGDLFLAIKGARANGHDYVAQALDKGAVAAVVAEIPRGVDRNYPSLIWVPDVTRSLEQLGQQARSRVQGKIVAVTGSVGKTGTKEALRHILQAHGMTSASEASYNNHWGVPLSLARMPKESQYGIFEIGMNHPGEIQPLAQWVQPHVALITHVSLAHRAGFDSLDSIAHEKSEIFKGFCKGDIGSQRVAVLNRDLSCYDFLSDQAKKNGATSVISFGSHEKSDVRLLSCEQQDTHSIVQASILGRSYDYTLSLPGQHWVMNSLGVLAVCEALGVSIDPGSFATLPSLRGRGRVHQVTYEGKNFTIIDESYNANPASMGAALDLLGSFKPQEGGRRLAVLGDIGELGVETRQSHLDLEIPIRINHVQGVWACGPEMAHLYALLDDIQRLGQASTVDELIPYIKKSITAEDVILLKGSRSMGLERVLEAFS